MRIRPALLATLLLAGLSPAVVAATDRYDPSLDPQRYAGCVRALEADATKAELFAIEWQARGGGLPARHCQALAQLHRGQYAAAAQTLAKAAHAAEAEKSPRAADFWGQAGNASMLAGNARAAITQFTTALTAAADFPADYRASLHLDRARAETEASDLAAARDDLDQALTLDRQSPLAWMLSAALARRQGDLLRAALDIAKASDMAPDDPDIMLEQANIAYANADEAAARQVWTQLVRQAPDSEAGKIAARALARGAATP